VTVAVRGMAPLLQVFDMPTSLRFYRDQLGFELVQSDAPGEPIDWAMLRIGDAVNVDEPPMVTHYGFKSISLTDPDGYVLCFHWPATERS
jgi:glyoxylase I family protein